MELNATTARVHWELIVQPNPSAGDGAVQDAEPLALSGGFTRQLRTRFAPPPEPTPSRRRRLRVLVIADPAPGPGRLKGAEREGMDVAKLFEAFNRFVAPRRVLSS